MPMPPNGKSILQTPDPYHTPGYCGYVPQYKYRIGNTYGKTTHKLFVDNTVPSSGKLVLTDMYKVGHAFANRQCGNYNYKLQLQLYLAKKRYHM